MQHGTLDCDGLQASPGADGEHGGVVRRVAGAHTSGAGADAQPGLSIGHISPLSSNSLRIVDGQAIFDSLDDAPNISRMSRNDGGYVWLGSGRVGYYPDTVVGVDGSSASVEWCPDGSYIKVKKPSHFQVKSAIKAKSARGSVSGFSRKSRCRLLQTLAHTRRALLPVFITLTYPGQWPPDPKRWKGDLDKFAKRLLRRFPLIGAIWKLEPQKRGAPHFHLLVWCADMPQVALCALLRSWVSLAWYECVNSGDPRHLGAGTRVELVRSVRGLMFYASKYLGKPVEVSDDSWGRPGRFWGIIGRANIPWAESLSTWLYYGQACTLIRWLRRFRRSKKFRWRGDRASMWGVVESPDTWLTNLERFGTC